MAYAALTTIQTIATGQPFLAATLQQTNDNGEFLIDPPSCSIKETTPQSIATATDTALTADEENYDNDSMHSTATNTSRVTVQTAGRYLAAGTVEFASNSTGGRRFGFRVNGTTSYSLVSGPTSSTAAMVLSGSRTFILAAGDYLEVMASQSSGGNLDVTLLDFSVLFITR